MLALTSWIGPDNAGYYMRRIFEKRSSRYLPVAVAVFFVGALPLIVSSLKPDTSPIPILGAFGPIGGVATLVSGVATALYGYYLKAKSALPGIAGQIFATAGSLVFLTGVLLFCFVLGRGVFLASQGDVALRAPLSVGEPPVVTFNGQISSMEIDYPGLIGMTVTCHCERSEESHPASTWLRRCAPRNDGMLPLHNPAAMLPRRVDQVLTGFRGAEGGMRRQRDVRQFGQRVIRRQRLDVEDVEPGMADVA